MSRVDERGEGYRAAGTHGRRELGAARLRRALVLGIVAILSLLHAGRGVAGYIVQPASGVTTGLQPSFLVFLDSNDSLARVHVGTSPIVDEHGYSPDEIGSCSPTTPFGEPGKYSCAPFGYSPSYASRLVPGTYYWWMSYWRSDGESPFGRQQLSGPFSFVVTRPQPPAEVALLSPADGATLKAPFRVHARIPAGAQMRFYAALGAERQEDGSPLGLELASCEGDAPTTAVYVCDVDSPLLLPGMRYYWWVVVEQNGDGWVYGPRSVAIEDTTPSVGGGRPGSGGSGRRATMPRAPLDQFDAPRLRTVDRWTGQSAKHRKLTAAAYRYSVLLHRSRRIAVACWSDKDWPNVSGEAPDDLYSTLGFWSRLQPRWLHLSPSVCRGLQTLLTSRPTYPNRITANALDTLTHEMLHALGWKDEALVECFSMQTSLLMAHTLGLGDRYGARLARLTLANYSSHPPRYTDVLRCREGGAWDIWPSEPSPPWHDFGV